MNLIKIGKRIINMENVTVVFRYDDGSLNIYLSDNGDTPVEVEQGSTADHLWSFLSSASFVADVE